MDRNGTVTANGFTDRTAASSSGTNDTTMSNAYTNGTMKPNACTNGVKYNEVVFCEKNLENSFDVDVFNSIKHVMNTLVILQ